MTVDSRQSGPAVLLALTLLACGKDAPAPAPAPSPATPPTSAPAPSPAPGRVVLARVNDLPVYRDDFVDALRSGRLGASPELVLDELISLTLVVRECELQQGVPACAGPGTLRDRAEAFLARAFPADRVCRDEAAPDAADRAYDRLSRRRVDPSVPRDDPSVRLAVEIEACEARARTVRRAWVQALRQAAAVRVDRSAVEAAAREVEGDAP